MVEELEYEITPNELIIRNNPWMGNKEMETHFVVKRWEISKGGPAAQVNKFFQEQLLPAKEELKRLHLLEKEESRKTTSSRTRLKKVSKTLQTIKKIKSELAESDKSE